MVLIISILDTGIPDRRMSHLRSPLRKGSDTDCRKDQMKLKLFRMISEKVGSGLD